MTKISKNKNKIQAKNPEHIQEILSQNLSIYRLIAENMYDAIYTLDTKGNFSFVNDVALKRSGYERKWFIGRSFLDFVLPENKEVVQKSFKSVMRGEAVPAYELSYINASGKSLWIEINATPIVDRENIIGVLVVSRMLQREKGLRESSNFIAVILKPSSKAVLQNCALQTNSCKPKSHSIKRPKMLCAVLKPIIALFFITLGLPLS